MSDFRKALERLRLAGTSTPFSIGAQLKFLKGRCASTSNGRIGAGWTPARSAVDPFGPATGVPMGHAPIPDMLPKGEIERTRYGSHYVVRNAYGREYFHGKMRIGRLCQQALLRLMGLAKVNGDVEDRSRIVFLDTETTGIQGGTGMCPFLVGLGFFRADTFHLLQYFIRDFDEEPSMLEALGEFLREFQLIITYNGATFDLPLLDTRFTLARLPVPFEGMSHFDLLFTARRLWRHGHGSCRLTALERELLAFLRGPDIPGSMIPRTYFDFLLGREASGMGSVFSHNAYDVLSLAALTTLACDRVVEEPLPFDDALDLYSLGRLYESSEDWRRSIRLYELAVRAGLPENYRLRALEHLSILYRRSGAHDRSLEVCLQLVESPQFSFAGYEGAAIYYEHAARDLESGERVLREGLERLAHHPKASRWKQLLESRQKRLRQKVLHYD